MGKFGKYGRRNSRLIAMFFAISVSVVAAPQAMAGWGDEGSKSMGSMPGHGMHKSGGAGSWMGGNAGGGSFDMMSGDGFMTARLRAVWTLDLSKEQKAKIRAIQRELRSQHWALQDKIELAADKLFDLYRANHRDPKAIGKVYDEIFDYRRQKIEIAIEAGNKAEAVLTKRQLDSLKKWRPQHKWGGGWMPKMMNH